MSPSILIVEDEPLLAMALSEQLHELGYAVAGVAPTLAKASALLAQKSCDAVILDCNLRGESSQAIAYMLRERRIPFLFHTGYSVAQIPEHFKSVAVLTKPVPLDVLASAVRELLDEGSKRQTQPATEDR